MELNYCQVVMPKEIKVIMKSSVLFSSLNKYSYYTRTSNKHMLLKINIRNMHNNISTRWYSNISISWQWWIFSYQNYAYNPAPWCTCPQPAYEAFLIRNYIEKKHSFVWLKLKSDQTGLFKINQKWPNWIIFKIDQKWPNWSIFKIHSL